MTPPTTKLVTMTQAHVKLLKDLAHHGIGAWITNPEVYAARRDHFSEILSVVRSLVSGETVNLNPKTHIAVEREEIDKALNQLAKIGTDRTVERDRVSRDAVARRIRGWLSSDTPKEKATDG